MLSAFRCRKRSRRATNLPISNVSVIDIQRTHTVFLSDRYGGPSEAVHIDSPPTARTSRCGRPVAFLFLVQPFLSVTFSVQTGTDVSRYGAAPPTVRRHKGTNHDELRKFLSQRKRSDAPHGYICTCDVPHSSAD